MDIVLKVDLEAMIAAKGIPDSGISPDLLKQICKGGRPSYVQAFRIAQYLGTTIDKIWGIEGRER